MIPLVQTFLFFGALSLFLGAGFVVSAFFASHRPSFFIQNTAFSVHPRYCPRRFLHASDREKSAFLLDGQTFRFSLHKHFYLWRIAWYRKHHQKVPSDKIPPSHSSIETERFLFFASAPTLFLKPSTSFRPATDLRHHLLLDRSSPKPTDLYQERSHRPTRKYQLADPAPIADFIIGNTSARRTRPAYGSRFFSAFPVTSSPHQPSQPLAPGRPHLQNRRDIPDPTAAPTGTRSSFLLFLYGPLHTLILLRPSSSPEASSVNIMGISLFLSSLSFPACIPRKITVSLVLGFSSPSLSPTPITFDAHILFVLIGTSILFYDPHKLRRSSEDALLPYHCHSLPANPLILFLVFGLFSFFVAMPTYIETHAVGTALGTPTKLTRVGLTLTQITETSGACFALSIVGLILVSRRFPPFLFHQPDTRLDPRPFHYDIPPRLGVPRHPLQPYRHLSLFPIGISSYRTCLAHHTLSALIKLPSPYPAPGNPSRIFRLLRFRR